MMTVKPDPKLQDHVLTLAEIIANPDLVCRREVRSAISSKLCVFFTTFQKVKSRFFCIRWAL
jgi:hypothetical protein